MKHAFFYFLRPSLVPELCADITAGAPRHTHRIFIPVFTVWAFPGKFSMLVRYNLNFTVVSALAAIIAFRV